MIPALPNAACREPENAPKFANIGRDLSEPYLTCLSCLDRTDCLAWALKHENSGFWAGFSGKGLDAERERLGIQLVELRAGDHVPTRGSRSGAARAKTNTRTS